MILIIGGSCQNKKEYAMQKYAVQVDEIIDLKIDTCLDIQPNVKIIDNLQDSVKDALLKNEFSLTIFDHILIRSPDIILLCDEVGSGIVPIDAFDREYRDAVGALCCYLAKKACSVHRVVCGLGMVIKDA